MVKPRAFISSEKFLKLAVSETELRAKPLEEASLSSEAHRTAIGFLNFWV